MPTKSTGSPTCPSTPRTTRASHYSSIAWRQPPNSLLAHSHAADCRDGILVHYMAGCNRSAALVVAYLMLRDKRGLLELFAECSAARPSILQNVSATAAMSTSSKPGAPLCVSLRVASNDGRV